MPVASLAAVALALTGLTPRPEVYTTWRAPVDIRGHELHVTFVKPVRAREPTLLVLFATGDAGWRGASGDIFEHLAAEGYYLAGYDAREIVRHVKSTAGLAKISDAAAGVDALIVHARSALGLAEGTGVVVTGFSRGATFVVFTAAVPSLQHHVSGAIAMALTRESDFLEAPPLAERPPQLQVDDKGRIQTYPAIALAGLIPFAVIQAKGDRYVTADEARRLFGSNTPTRRLYDVDSSSHGFGGAEDELFRDLDDALSWIEK